MWRFFAYQRKYIRIHLKGGILLDILSLERIWYHTPIVESDNLSRYCPIDDFTFMGMESDYISESSKFHLHVFYRMD